LKKLLLIFLFFSLSSFAKETLIVLIPGAASSGDQVWVRGMGLIFDPFHLTKYFKNLESILKHELKIKIQEAQFFEHMTV
jgi:hypothetical protein